MKKFVCTICGYVFDQGEFPPEVCPICNYSSKFKEEIYIKKKRERKQKEGKQKEDIINNDFIPTIISEFKFPDKFGIDEFIEDRIVAKKIYYTIAHDIKSIEDLKKEIDENGNGNIILAFCWTKNDLETYNYSTYLEKPKFFKRDLDLTSPLYISNTIGYFISKYTEALYTITSQDIKELKEYGCRVMNNIKYQIYRKIEKN